MSEQSLSAAGVELRRPFTPAAIRIKPQTVTKEAPFKGLVTFYIDARLAVERLNTVVGAGDWSDEYRVLSMDPNTGIPTECRLTVLGVTKADVGQIEPSGKHDNKSVKSAYSDALKRAAVKFGVGAFLYNLPSVWAEVTMGPNGKARGFTDGGRRAAMAAYREWLNSGHAYGDPLDHGDVESHVVESEETVDARPLEVDVPQTWAQVEELVMFFGAAVWREFQAFMRAARAAEPRFQGKRTDVFRQAAAGVAVALRSEFEPDELPGPGLQDLSRLWSAAVAGAVLTPVYDEPEQPAEPASADVAEAITESPAIPDEVVPS